jgi:uncharacterized membrane protein
MATEPGRVDNPAMAQIQGVVEVERDDSDTALGRRLSPAGYRDWLVGAGLMALWLMATLPFLGVPSLWLDESETAFLARVPWRLFWPDLVHEGGNMTLFYLAERVVAAFGSSEWWLRLPADLAVGAAIWATYELARTLLSRPLAVGAAVIAGVLMAGIGFDARAPSSTTALVAWSAVVLVRLIEEPTQARRRAFQLLVVLALWSQLTAVFFGITEMAIVASQPGWRRDLVRLFRLGLPIAIGGLPMVVLAALRGPGVLYWAAGVSAQTFRAALSPAIGWVPLLKLALVLSGWLPFLIKTVWRRSLSLPASPARVARDLTAALLVAPIATLTLVSLVGPHVLLALSTYPIVPFAAIAGVVGWEWIGFPLIRSITVVSFIAANLVVVVLGVLAPLENWRAATAYVLNSSNAGQAVVFFSATDEIPFSYYWRQDGSPASAPTPVLPAAPLDSLVNHIQDHASLDATEVQSVASRYPRLWVVASHQAPTPARRLVYDRLMREIRQSYCQSSVSHFTGPITVYMFSRC